LLAPLIGRAEPLPAALTERYPELLEARVRRGGLPVRIGGWALGARWVAGITLWNTIFLAPDTAVEPELLLHELRHVHQFQAGVAFPLRYLWASLRRGYHHNPYEADARAWAAERVRRDRAG
jgi:hypothetical protein